MFVVVVPRVLNPLIDVAVHIVKAEGIRLFLANTMCPLAGIRRVPGIFTKRGFVITEREPRLTTSPRRVLPLRLAGQAIFLAGDPGQPQPRGVIEVKNKPALEMFFLNRIKPEFCADADGVQSNEAFWRGMAT
jgi:hypothetical protein